MPSPFPGMNPYLEAIWHDFHERFIPAAAAYLVPQVRPRYFVSIDENVYLHDVRQDEQILPNDRRSATAMPTWSKSTSCVAVFRCPPRVAPTAHTPSW